jgi:hypothetical protein
MIENRYTNHSKLSYHKTFVMKKNQDPQTSSEKNLGNKYKMRAQAKAAEDAKMDAIGQMKIGKPHSMKDDEAGKIYEKSKV